MFSVGLIYVPHIYFGTRLQCYPSLSLSLSPLLFMVQALELQAFQNSSCKKKYFLCPRKHFLTAGLSNSSYYFCVLCYKQCRWSSLVIVLHQSSFRFVYRSLILFFKKDLIAFFFLFLSWVIETQHYNEPSKELYVF